MKAEGLINKEIKTANQNEKKENNKDKLEKSDRKSDSSKKEITFKKIDDFFKNKNNNNIERDTKSSSKVEEKKVKSTNGKNKSKFLIINDKLHHLTYYYHLFIYFLEVDTVTQNLVDKNDKPNNQLSKELNNSKEIISLMNSDPNLNGNSTVSISKDPNNEQNNHLKSNSFTN
jgi:hypothetical protein